MRVRSRIKEPIQSPGWALQEVDPIEPVITFSDSPSDSLSGSLSGSLSDSAVSITNGKITAVITSNSYFDGQQGYAVDACEIEFLDSSGKVFLRELDSHGALKRKARDFHPLAGGGFSLTAGFQSSPSEHLVGMGMYQEDLIDLKGATFALTQRNSQATVPFVMSSEGYGFLWNNPAIGQAVFGTNRTEWHAQATDQLDYWVTAGKTPRDIAKRYSEVTGCAPVMPEYALGLWQSKLRYKSQDELLQVAREDHER